MAIFERQLHEYEKYLELEKDRSIFCEPSFAEMT